jgi:periplasmic protein CpxP/Spy
MSSPVVSLFALDGCLAATYRDAITRGNWTPLIRS